VSAAVDPRPRVFVCHLQHSQPKGRGAGWYWWIEGADDFTTGPFNTEADAHSDIHRVSQESDGR